MLLFFFKKKIQKMFIKDVNLKKNKSGVTVTVLRHTTDEDKTLFDKVNISVFDIQ